MKREAVKNLSEVCVEISKDECCKNCIYQEILGGILSPKLDCLVEEGLEFGDVGCQWVRE